MADRLKKKIRTRAGHRAYVRKTLGDITKDGVNLKKEERSKLVNLKTSLEEQYEAIKALDNEILDLLSDKEGVEDEEIAAEIEEAGRLRAEIKTAITTIEELLKGSETTESISAKENQANSQQARVIRAKLPKLQVRQFSGKPEQWQEFWDGFENSIHSNPNLSSIDKFSYLRGLVEEPARTAIAGFALTSANYEAALELLKRRFGKKENIQKAHISELMKVQPVTSARDTAKLRKLHDIVETHHRGLQALEVDPITYSAIVVPAIVDKLPDSVRLAITRGKKLSSEWSMEELLKELLAEVELREEHTCAPEKTKNEEKIPQKKRPWHGPTTDHTLLTKAGNDSCAFCRGKHEHQDCNLITSVHERKQLFRKYGRCFICSKKGHIATKCNSDYKCTSCGGKHHRSICESRADSASSSVNNGLVSTGLHVGAETRVALQTAQAVLKGKSANCRVRVMFDSGSHRSFVTTTVVRSIGLEIKRKEWVELSTFGQSLTDKGLRNVYELEIAPLRSGKTVKIEAYEVPNISQITNEHVEVIKTHYPHLQGLWFSDVCVNQEEFNIEILIGSDYLWSFQDGRTIRGEQDEPVAVGTSLGWVLSGPLKGSNVQSKRSNTAFVRHVSVKENEGLERSVQRLWDVETLGIREENEVHEALKDGIRFTGERYQVSLPWKEGHPELPNNYQNSLRRLKGQLSKLRREPEILGEYDQIIKEQCKEGIVEKVAKTDCSEQVHYLPHHAVVRKQAKTTKVRVVYDASAKENKHSASLNDCLHVGPALSPLLFEILLRFREKRVVLVGDIEKAFLNVEVSEKDRDYLRFLWVNDVSSEAVEPIVYRFCRVVFGVNSSPFLLNATLQHHLDTFINNDPEFVRKMKEGFYVDDLVSGDETTEKAFVLYKQAKERLASGGFRLRKWMSNSKELMDKISLCAEGKEKESAVDDQTYAKTKLGGKEGRRAEKVLGQEWNCETDMFQFDLSKLKEKADNQVATKRSVLSLLASLFDPLGIISPVIVSAKILFQELCVDKVGWDEELSEERKSQLEKWLRDLESVGDITALRCVYGSLGKVAVKCSLHGFADASLKAYCAVIYFVCEAGDSIHTEMLTSKTRVAPLKPQTIPRLELMSARILAQLMNTVKQALKENVEIVETYLWLDSKTALCWINNRGEWKQFVRHRVNEILQLSKKEEWGHCPGKENPADIGSRGMLGSELKESRLWWKGPLWLMQPKDEWPNREICVIEETPESLEEAKKSSVLVVQDAEVSGISLIIEISRYSRLDRLLRVTSLVLRFIFNLCAKKRGKEKRTGEVRTEEMIDAEKRWVQEVQRELKATPKFQTLVKNLGIVDCDGIMKCKGRLENSDLDLEVKEPIVLLENHRFTLLVIECCHERVYHSGVRGTLAELRTKFWVSKGRQVVKKVLSKCLVCRKIQGKACGEPPVAALPEFRVKKVEPFSKVGVDFAGPLYVKGETGKMVKVYIALFSCCVTRAIHLDLVTSLSTTAFIRCLRKFAARRGTPNLIISDNAKTFKAASKRLRKLGNDPEVVSHLTKNRIEWRFNLEKAPWWGGFYERMVGNVKRCLRKVLGNARLKHDELLTILLEIEGTLNSRPLTYEYDEVGAEVLTPSHLVFGRRLVSLPDEIHDDEEEGEDEKGYLKRFRYLAKKKYHFWNRWHREYLIDLREYHRNSKNKVAMELKVGDVVLVKEDNVKRNQWKLGKVEVLIVGKDRAVRGAKLRVISKGKPVYLNRPLQKLYPLEVGYDSKVLGDSKLEKDDGADTPKRGVRTTPSRAAAIDSDWKTRAMLDPQL